MFFQSNIASDLYSVATTCKILLDKYCSFPSGISSHPHTQICMIVLVITICLQSRRQWTLLGFTVLVSTACFVLAWFAGFISMLLLYGSVSKYQLCVTMAIGESTGGLGRGLERGGSLTLFHQPALQLPLLPLGKNAALCLHCPGRSVVQGRSGLLSATLGCPLETLEQNVMADYITYIFDVRWGNHQETV